MTSLVTAECRCRNLMECIFGDLVITRIPDNDAGKQTDRKI